MCLNPTNPKDFYSKFCVYLNSLFLFLQIAKDAKKAVIKFFEKVLDEELVERAMIRSHFPDKENLFKV